MKFENIIFEVADRAAKITINKPPTNIIDVKTLREMIQAMEAVKKGKGIKAVVITGAGNKAFSAGMSIQDHLPDSVEEMIPLFGNLFRTMMSLEPPTLAVVNGYCLGGGCEVACFCDMVIASEGSQFGQPEIKLGVFAPLAVAAYPRMIGRKKAFELLFTGDTIDAREAERIGLVNRVVPQEKLEEEVDRLLKKLTSLSPLVIRASKRALYAGYDVGFEAALAASEDIYLNTCAKSKQGFEGLHAFLEKRDPVWEDKE